MAEGHRMTAAQLADKLLQDEHADVLRESVAWMATQLIEAEVSGKIGAELGERSLERTTHRNGYRPRAWDTRVGSIELAIPRLRQGSYFPSFLEPRRRAEQALVAVVQEAYVNGVSTRKVDRLVGADGPAPSEQGPGLPAVPWPGRAGPGLPRAALGGRLPLPVAGRQDRAGPRAGWGAPQGPGDRLRRPPVWPPGGDRPGRGRGRDPGAFWRAFLRSLRARGLDGVKLCISDAHQGLKNAIAQVLGCPWQRCTVHFLRDMLGHVTRAQQPLVSGAIRGIFTATTHTEARHRLGQVVQQLAPHAPKVARLLEDAEADLLAFYAFPAEH